MSPTLSEFRQPSVPIYLTTVSSEEGRASGYDVLVVGPDTATGAGPHVSPHTGKTGLMRKRMVVVMRKGLTNAGTAAQAEIGAAALVWDSGRTPTWALDDAFELLEKQKMTAVLTLGSPKPSLPF